MKKIRDKELLFYIAVRIKKLRHERNISQERFYIDTEIHIARIETVKINITISTISAICKYFDITVSKFFEDYR